MFVLVVVPAYNEEENIKECLGSLLAQKTSGIEYDVVVVDNGSTDSTRDIVSGFRVNCVSCPSGNIGKVRNRGIEFSYSDIVAYLDADCSVGRDWIQNGVNALKSDSRVGGIQGTLLSPSNGSLFQKAWAPTSCGNRVREIEHIATGACFFWRRTLLEAGLFDEILKTGEDTDLSRKVRGLGYLLYQRDDCSAVHHGYPKTMVSFFRRQFQQGRSYAYFNTSLLDKTFISVFVFGVLAVFSVVMAASGFFVLSYILGFGSFLIITIYAIYRSLWNRRDNGFFQLPSALLVNLIYFLGRFSGFMFQIIKNFRKKSVY